LALSPSKQQRDKIVRHVGTSQSRFDELMKVFIKGPYRITQRAALPLSYCVVRQPKLLNTHFNSIVKYLETPDLPDTLKRNLLRTLQFVKIPNRYQGRIANCCFGFLDGKQPIAVKVFAMTLLADLAQENEELKNEIIPLLEEQIPYGSAGFVSRAKRILKRLK
jgi:hypothetical protein